MFSFSAEESLEAEPQDSKPAGLRMGKRCIFSSLGTAQAVLLDEVDFWTNLSEDHRDEQVSKPFSYYLAGDADQAKVMGTLSLCALDLYNARF